MKKRVLLTTFLALVVAACGTDDGGAAGGTDATQGGAGQTTDTDDSGAGTSKYYDGPESASLGADGNEARCSTCHSNDGSDGYSGDSLQNIAYRTGFKGGDAPTLLDASNACITGWMGGEALTADDAAWNSLEAYLQSISDESVTEPNTLAPEVLADEAAYEAAYAGGNAAAGEAAFATWCGKCHGAGVTVGAVEAYPVSTVKAFSAGRIAQKARTSGPPPSGTADASDTTGGPMPFFEPDELSQESLADIIAWLKS